MTILRDFVDRVLELSEIRTAVIGDITYTKETAFKRVKSPEQTSPKTLEFYNLQGLVDYLPYIDFDKTGLFFAVMSPTEVSLLSSPDPSNDNIQFKFAEACLGVGDFRFASWYPLEDFIINLLAQFEKTSNRDVIIGMMGDIANGHIVQNTDDKFSQTLQVKTGLTTKANETVENPITLLPYRTFREVGQPESEFILRYRSQTDIVAALFEGDGGRWKLDAISSIKAWLSEKTDIPVIG